MSLKLLYASQSPPSRASLLTIRALGLDVDLVQVNLAAHEHLTTEFLEINPFHTVPTLQDEDFTIWDSHAINAYLVDKHADDDSLYPKDLQKRAVVDQRLHFDSHVLSARLGAILSSILREGAKTIAKDKADALLQGLTLIESVFESTKNSFIAGNTLTIADFSIVATISSANAVLPLASNRFPHIFEWLARMEALPYYKEANQEGLDAFSALIKSKHIVRQISARSEVFIF
jgi:glutathione S-transferase